MISFIYDWAASKCKASFEFALTFVTVEPTTHLDIANNEAQTEDLLPG